MRAFAAHGSGEVPLGIIFEGVDPDDGATKKMKATVESALDHSRWMRLIKPAVPQGSDRADAMFNSILHAVLPIVRNAIGAKLVDENIKGGLALKGTPTGEGKNRYRSWSVTGSAGYDVCADMWGFRDCYDDSIPFLSLDISV